MMTEEGRPVDSPSVGTGVTGLDTIVGGGYAEGRMHLLEGPPGAGKTTIALQFLLEGARLHEPVLYVALAETADEIAAIARSHHWHLADAMIYELVPSPERLRPDEQNSILPPGEVEFTETVWAVLQKVSDVQPTRVVIDSLAELRLLAGDGLHYRRQLLALKEFFAGRDCTLLVLDHSDQAESIESIAHSVIRLEQVTPEMGSSRRRLHVEKIRGSGYRSGYHDFIIERGGVRVFPRLVAAEHRVDQVSRVLSSGVRELDVLLGGGLPTGTSALLLGPAGAGKSVVATQFAVTAAANGMKTSVFLFEESRHTFIARSDGLGLGLSEAIDRGKVALRELSPAEVPPGQFDALVREAVEQDGAGLVVIDSLNGYLNAMSAEALVALKLHELLAYLGEKNVLTLLTVAQHGLIGNTMITPVDVSYLADTVILLRYFEAQGELRQAISIVKKRTGVHERTIREFRLNKGIQVGEPLSGFQGVLSGTPIFFGAASTLMQRGEE